MANERWLERFHQNGSIKHRILLGDLNQVRWYMLKHQNYSSHSIVFVVELTPTPNPGDDCENDPRYMYFVQGRLTEIHIDQYEHVILGAT